MGETPVLRTIKEGMCEMVCPNENCCGIEVDRTNQRTNENEQKDVAMTTLSERLNERALKTTTLVYDDGGAPTVDEAVFEPSRPKPRTTKAVVAFLTVAALTGAALATVGFTRTAGKDAELTATTEAAAEARRAVTVAAPTRDGAAYELRLPGSTAPLQTTVLYARTNGYLKAFHADIGDHVAAGQLLAEIESPEVDEQLNEARAALNKAKADRELAASRLDRFQRAYKEAAASHGELDDAVNVDKSSVAAVKAAEASVARLEREVSFQKVVAPFDGVVTARNIELGSLVTSGSSVGVPPLFRVEQSGVLKVYVDAPQSASPSVAVGQSVKVDVREFPGRTFDGKVARTAGSVDASTRTLRTEIHIRNPRGELLAGMYAQVHLAVQDPRHPLRIPASTLVIDATGPQVVTVNSDSNVKRIAVALGRDFGKEVEVTGGLTGAERLVVNPRDDLRDGDSVNVQK
jgi:RND family efflux transporter MFP subunit